ncbi:beta-ketoacyl-ACP synthase 3 [Priestia megaterium]|uniref:beta-ketoacyl-ACP synthase 3 n=1 Tax=Priestia megaterium TaxID=1404 RepID=UPI002079580D|nr:beta-ketoacyl-ACP synthase 3 [Priestia megaterium]USL45588.1 beta-ketoacyl-ACP synthase 3 [Priestia megaterium]
MFKVKISGIGKTVGSRVVASTELEKVMDVKPGWIEKATGIKSRNYVDFENGETALTLGVSAAKKAVEDAGITLDKIDCIIGANGSPLQAIPCAAALYQQELGLGDSGVPSFDIDTTCYSFGVALFLASGLVDSGLYKNILIISADAPSPTLDITDNEVRALFGDGAGAVVLTKTSEDEPSRVHHFKMNTYGSGASFTEVRGGGTLKHPNHPETTPLDNVFHMEGKKIFKYAVRYLPSYFESFFVDSGINQKELKFILPHQTSKHGIDIFRKFGFASEQIASHLSIHGNCIAASIPMLLHDYIKNGEIKRGDQILLFGTSAGLSLGGLALTY